uniref:Uncharacterized protein n=1 Tax=Romanomermis culicivorax TaxID=13658 RepID=A0A915HTE2_ROMCU
MHDCKTPNNGSTSVKFLMPYTNQKEINITDVINLSAHYSDEEKIKSTDFRVPCDPF